MSPCPGAWKAPRFVHLGQRSQLGQLSDGVLREWIGSMSPQEREQFSRAFFDILSRGGRTKTLEDLRSGGLAAGAALLREYAGADEEKKKDHLRDLPPPGGGRERRADEGRRSRGAPAGSPSWPRARPSPTCGNEDFILNIELTAVLCVTRQ